MTKMRLLGLSVVILLGLMSLNATTSASYFSKGVKAYNNGNHKTAAKLFKKACDGGYATGCYNLGDLYANGQGVNQNKIKAYQYWMKAAKAGNITAQNNLDILCKQSPWACSK